MVQLYKELNGVVCHTYHDTCFPWIEYVSVSKIKGGYTKEYDAKANSERVSLKPTSEWYGIPPEEIRAEWRRMKEEGLSIGTMVHDIAERYFLCRRHEDFIPANETEAKIALYLKGMRDRYGIGPKNSVLESAVSIDLLDEWGDSISIWNKRTLVEIEDAIKKAGRWKQYLEEKEFVEDSEKKKHAIKFITKKGLAGTPDVRVEYRSYFDFHDFKTDKKMRDRGYYDKNRNREKMLFPVDHLDSCNIEQYSLQIWLYAIMYEVASKKRFRAGILQHIDKKSFRLKEYSIPNRRHEARELIQHYFKMGKYKTRSKYQKQNDYENEDSQA